MDEPTHPVHAMTTYELAGYRRNLEHSLKPLPGLAAVREQLQTRLDEVLAEQEERARIAAHDLAGRANRS